VLFNDDLNAHSGPYRERQKGLFSFLETNQAPDAVILEVNEHMKFLYITSITTQMNLDLENVRYKIIILFKSFTRFAGQTETHTHKVWK